MKSRFAIVALGIAILASSALAQDAPSELMIPPVVTDPNATYISADPNAPRYEIKALPYNQRIAAAKTYQDLSDIRDEVFGRDDLSTEEKTKWIEAISGETTRRLDAEARLLKAQSISQTILLATRNPTEPVAQMIAQSIDSKADEIKRELLDPPSDENLSKVSDPSTCRDLDTGLSRDQKEQAVRMFQLANAAYQDKKDAIPEGSTPLTRSELEKVVDLNTFSIDDNGFVIGEEGFAARIFRDDETGDLILSYRGSEDAEDFLKANFPQLAGQKTRQYDLAEKLLGDLLEKTDERTFIHVVGHSLGAGLGSWAMAANKLGGRVRGWFVNGAGLSRGTLSRTTEERIRDAAQNIVNIREEYDIVSMPGSHLGPLYTVANDDLSGRWFGSHGVENTIRNIKKTMETGYVADALPRKTLEEELAGISWILGDPEYALSNHPVVAFSALLVNVASEAIANKASELSDAVAERTTSFLDSIGDVASTVWDWAKWQTVGAREMQGLLVRTGKLYDKNVPVVPDGGCPCNAMNYAKMRGSLGNAWRLWQKAYGAVNGFAALAYASKSFGEGMQVVFRVVEPKSWRGMGSSILGRVNDFTLEYLGGSDSAKDALIHSQLGDLRKLGESLQKIAATKWDECKTVEERLDYIQAVLDIRDEIRKLGDVNGALSMLGLGSQEFKALNDILKHSDAVADAGKAWLDAYKAEVEAAKYFSNLSEAMKILDEMRMLVPAYEKILARCREQAATCSCADECQCAHCGQKKDEPEEDDDPDPKEKEEDDPLAAKRIEGWEWIGTRSDREKRYNDIWDAAEEYSSPPACRCGAGCSCLYDEWKAAYDDFKRKQSSAYWGLKVIRSEGFLRSLKTTDNLLQYVPYFGTTYGIVRLAEELPEIADDIIDDDDIQKQMEDWRKWELDLSQMALGANDLIDEIEEIERLLGEQLRGDMAELRDVFGQQESLANRAESFRQLQKALKAKRMALSTQYPSAQQYATIDAQLARCERRAAEIAKRSEKLARRQSKLINNATKLTKRIGKAHPEFAKSARFARLGNILSAGFLVYDIARDDDDSMRGMWIQQAKLTDDYESWEEKRLIDAFNRLSEAYNAECKCPRHDLPPINPPKINPPEVPEPPDEEPWKPVPPPKTPIDPPTIDPPPKTPIDPPTIDPPPETPIDPPSIDPPPKTPIDPPSIDPPTRPEPPFTWPYIPPVIIEDPFPNPPTDPPTTDPDEPLPPQDDPGSGTDGGTGGDDTGGDDTGGGTGDGSDTGDDTDTGGDTGGDTDTGDDDPGDWSDAGQVLKTTVEMIVFPLLEEWIGQEIGKLTEKYPVLAEVFNALGIDTGSIMTTIRNVWGVLTGPGDLADKLKQLANMALEGLKKMLSNLLDWGINKLKDWLANVVLGFFESSGSDMGFVADNPGSPDFLTSVVQELLRLLAQQRGRASGMTHIIRTTMQPGATWSNGLELPGQEEVWNGTVTSP